MLARQPRFTCRVFPAPHILAPALKGRDLGLLSTAGPGEAAASSSGASNGNDRKERKELGARESACHCVVRSWNCTVASATGRVRAAGERGSPFLCLPRSDECLIGTPPAYIIMERSEEAPGPALGPTGCYQPRGVRTPRSAGASGPGISESRCHSRAHLGRRRSSPGQPDHRLANHLRNKLHLLGRPPLFR
jgi:hypothetical protein